MTNEHGECPCPQHMACLDTAYQEGNRPKQSPKDHMLGAHNQKPHLQWTTQTTNPFCIVLWCSGREQQASRKRQRLQAERDAACAVEDADSK